MRASAGVADATSDVLRRKLLSIVLVSCLHLLLGFDQVYLTQVINIETESDRDSAEKALRPFIVSVPVARTPHLRFNML